jgi:hypothetical protein
MKRLAVVPLGRLQDTLGDGRVVRHPERTAYRSASPGAFSDFLVAEFPNRPALLKLHRLQRQRERKTTDWRLVVPDPWDLM